MDPWHSPVKISTRWWSVGRYFNDMPIWHRVVALLSQKSDNILNIPSLCQSCRRNIWHKDRATPTQTLNTQTCVSSTITKSICSSLTIIFLNSRHHFKSLAFVMLTQDSSWISTIFLCCCRHFALGTLRRNWGNLALKKALEIPWSCWHWWWQTRSS